MNGNIRRPEFHINTRLNIYVQLWHLSSCQLKKMIPPLLSISTSITNILIDHTRSNKFWPYSPDQYHSNQSTQIHYCFETWILLLYVMWRLKYYNWLLGMSSYHFDKLLFSYRVGHPACQCTMGNFDLYVMDGHSSISALSPNIACPAHS